MGTPKACAVPAAHRARSGSWAAHPREEPRWEDRGVQLTSEALSNVALSSSAGASLSYSLNSIY